jgi:hypothetical protein
LVAEPWEKNLARKVEGRRKETGTKRKAAK